MCSNQKGRQLSAFLLLAPLRNVELPENVVLPGNVEPPGTVEHRLDDADEPVLSPPRLPRNTALPRNAEPSGHVEPPGHGEHQLAGADGAAYSSLSAASLSADPSPRPPPAPLTRLPPSRSKSRPALDHCQSSARFTSPAVTGLE